MRNKWKHIVKLTTRNIHWYCRVSQLHWLILITNWWATTQLLLMLTSRAFRPKGLCQLLTRVVLTVVLLLINLLFVYMKVMCMHLITPVSILGWRCASGTCPFCLHVGVPCGFSTFFNVSVAINVTAHDARMTPSNHLLIIATVVQHLPCKSNFQQSILCPNQDTSLHWEGVYAATSQWPFLRIQCFIGKSQDCHVTLALRDSSTKCDDKNMVWVLRKKENLAEEVDLASQTLYPDFHWVGSWSQVFAQRCDERSLFLIAPNLVAMM